MREREINVDVVWRSVAVICGLVFASFLPVPLLGILQAESSAVAALVVYFATGAATVFSFRRNVSGRFVALRSAIVAVVPMLVLTLSLLWRPNCGWLQGLGLYWLFVGPSALLAVSIATFCCRRTRRPIASFLAISVVLLVAKPVIDIGFYPQFYTYNQIFGAILGPVYDEELYVGPGLLWFRFGTVLWAVLIFGFARASSSPRVTLQRILPATLLVLLYFFAPRLGLHASYEAIERELGQTVETAHFVTHYAATDRLDSSQVRLLASVQEYRYTVLASKLEAQVSGKIHVYLYPDEETKGRLTGSRRTSITPVWLSRPQIHLLSVLHDDVFSHELVHVFGREFGMPVIRASPLVGLVEGLAVALEAPNGLPSDDDQVKVLYPESPERESQLADGAARLMSPVGFWTGRGAVSYSVSGSFVRYLLGSVGPDRMKLLYRTGSFGRIGADLKQEAESWADSLLSSPAPSREIASLASARFSSPSLFEKRCPHYISRPEKRFKRAAKLLADGDTTGATHAIAVADTSYAPVRSMLARIAMSQGDLKSAEELVDSRMPGVTDRILAADLEAVRTGRAAGYDSLLMVLPSFAEDARARLVIRKSALRSATPVTLFYSGSVRRCESSGRHGPAAFWICGQLFAREGDYFGASVQIASAIQELQNEIPGGDRDLLFRFLTRRRADLLLLSGHPDLAAEAYADALANSEEPETGAASPVSELLADRLDLANFLVRQPVQMY